MFQFNSNKLIKLCRKLIGMIEDNQIAEELTDKIVGIENKYQTKFEAKNKYKLRVYDAVNDWNNKYRHEEPINIEERFDTFNGIWWFYLNNKNYHMYMKFQADGFFPFRQENSYEPEVFYKWVFELITDQGLSYFFHSKSPRKEGSQIGKELRKYYGEESFNVTHS